MNKIIKEQLERLKEYVCEVDGKFTSQITDDFTTVKFRDAKAAKVFTPSANHITVVFQDYIITPYAGFDLHTKFNGGVAPPSKQMTGSVLKETEKMLYLNLVDSSGAVWVGWCPKKSCSIIK